MLTTLSPELVRLQPNLPPLPLIDGCLFIDNSSLEYVITCDRSAEYHLIYKRKSSGQRAALNFGGGLHLGLGHRYEFCPDLCSGTDVEMQALQLMTKHFEAFPLEATQFRTPELASKMFRKYNEVYDAEPFRILEHNSKPLVELPFAHELCRIKVPFPVIVGNETRDYVIVMYIGRIDLVVLQDGQIFTLDHKTTSMMGDGFFKEQRVSPQHDGYCWAWKQTTGQLPAGYIINGIRTRAPVKRDESGEPKSSRTKRREDVEKDDFQRDIVFIDQTRIDEWYFNIIAIIKQFLSDYAEGYFPQKKKWCIGKYGPCQFYDVCSLAHDQRITFLKSNVYVDNTWSPLNERHHGEPRGADELAMPKVDLDNILEGAPSFEGQAPK